MPRTFNDDDDGGDDDDWVGALSPHLLKTPPKPKAKAARTTAKPSEAGTSSSASKPTRKARTPPRPPAQAKQRPNNGSDKSSEISIEEFTVENADGTESTYKEYDLGDLGRVTVPKRQRKRGIGDTIHLPTSLWPGSQTQKTCRCTIVAWAPSLAKYVVLAHDDGHHYAMPSAEITKRLPLRVE